MMYKFAEMDQGKIHLMLFTGSVFAPDFYKPLKETLNAKILGIRDISEYVGNALFEDTEHESVIDAVPCNSLTSKDRFRVKYEGEPYTAELTLSMVTTYCITTSSRSVRTMMADFTVRRDDEQLCPDKLLEEILAHFPDEEYEPLPEKPKLK